MTQPANRRLVTEATLPAGVEEALTAPGPAAVLNAAAAAAAETAVAEELAEGLPETSTTTAGLQAPRQAFYITHAASLDALTTPGNYVVEGANATEANNVPVDLRGGTIFVKITRSGGNWGIQTVEGMSGATGGRVVRYARRLAGITSGTPNWSAWTRETVQGEPGGGATVGTGAPTHAAPVGAEYVQTTALGGAVKWIKRAGTDATGWEQEPLLGSRPSGNIVWTAMTGMNFAPRSVGVDGALYFTYLNTTAVRSSDPTLVSREAGPDMSGQTVKNIRWVTRTTAGYVIVTSDAVTDTGAIWFSPTWTSAVGSWTKVQDTKAFTDISIGKPRVIAGTSWLVLGEYVTAVYPSVPRTLWLSTDGGQTWTSIKQTIVTDNAVNAHWHAAAITASGRIWASAGDGINSWFGYTDDKGKSWIPRPFSSSDPLYDGASDFQQPTVILDFGNRCVVCPDRGGATVLTGFWRVDPDTGRTTKQLELSSGEKAHEQYGTGSAQRGKEAYVTFPDHGSSSAKTYVYGTGDAGRSWHKVSEISTTGGSAHGPLVGPDRNGYVWMQPTSGSIPTYGSVMMRGTLPTWSWVD